MPVNGYSVGRDVTLVITTPVGTLRVNQITGFQSKPDMTDQKIKRIDGVTDHVRFPDGWSGSFDVERQDDTLDSYFAQVEDNYYAGQNELPCQITETIQEANGKTSQYRYTGVLLKLDDAGSWAGDKSVKQKLSFVASRRLKVA